MQRQGSFTYTNSHVDLVPVVPVQQQQQQQQQQHVFTRPALVTQASLGTTTLQVVPSGSPVQQQQQLQHAHIYQPLQQQIVEPVKYVVQYQQPQQHLQVIEQPVYVQQQPQQIQIQQQPVVVAVPQESPLPQGWQEVNDNSTGKKYYWNPATNETTWTRPQPVPVPQPQPQPQQQVIINGQQYLIAQQPVQQQQIQYVATQQLLDQSGNVVYIQQQPSPTSVPQFLNSNNSVVSVNQPIQLRRGYSSFSTTSSGSFDVADRQPRALSVRSIPSNYGQFESASDNGSVSNFTGSIVSQQQPYLQQGYMANNNQASYPQQGVYQQQQQQQQPLGIYSNQQPQQRGIYGQPQPEYAQPQQYAQPQGQQQPQQYAQPQGQQQPQQYGPGSQQQQQGQPGQQQAQPYGQQQPVQQPQANPREQFQHSHSQSGHNHSQSKNHAALHANQNNFNIPSVSRNVYETFEPRYE